MNAARVSPSVALAAYAEAWISGAKVVVFGDALSPLAERLIERGARHVQVYDVDAGRAREAAAASSSKQIAHAPLDLAGSAQRDGVFDVGIVEDLAIAGQGHKGLLATLARSLSRRGLALVGSRNPDVPARLIRSTTEPEQPLGYYDFYDAVSQHFEEVRMLGQTPFVGYAIADFSAGDASDVRIDTALLPSGAEEPEWFLALCSALPLSPDAFSVIQLPLAELDLGAGSERVELETEPLERVENAEAKIRELETALAELAAEGAREAEKYAAERARDAEKHAAERARDAERYAAERARDAAERRETERRESDKALALKLQSLQAELEKREEWLAALESRAATADERADQAQAQLEQLGKDQRKQREQLARAEQQLDEERRAKQKLEESARAHEQELAKRERRAEAEAQRAAQLASENKALAARVAELTAAVAESQRAAKQLAEEGDAEVRAELQQLEELLKDRAAEVGRLTQALHDTERFGRQLILKLAEAEAARSEPAPESPDLQGLTRRNAELAADLEAARWTISSLEANVGGQPTASTPSSAGQRRDESPSAEPAPAPGVDG